VLAPGDLVHLDIRRDDQAPRRVRQRQQHCGARDHPRRRLAVIGHFAEEIPAGQGQHRPHRRIRKIDVQQRAAVLVLTRVVLVMRHLLRRRIAGMTRLFGPCDRGQGKGANGEQRKRAQKRKRGTPL